MKKISSTVILITFLILNNSINVMTQEDDSGSAVLTTIKVKVNDKVIEFYTYTIEGYNYIKLRDLALQLDNTNKQFDVNWDRSNKSINIDTNCGYTIVGGEMCKSIVVNQKAIVNSFEIYKDGKLKTLNAYTII